MSDKIIETTYERNDWNTILRIMEMEKPSGKRYLKSREVAVPSSAQMPMERLLSAMAAHLRAESITSENYIATRQWLLATVWQQGED